MKNNELDKTINEVIKSYSNQALCFPPCGMG